MLIRRGARVHVQEKPTHPSIFLFGHGRLLVRFSLFYSFWWDPFGTRCTGTRPQKNRLRHLGFFFGSVTFPFRFFRFLFVLFRVFLGRLGPGTAEAKTLRDYVKKSLFMLKFFNGVCVSGVFFRLQNTAF